VKSLLALVVNKNAVVIQPDSTWTTQDFENIFGRTAPESSAVFDESSDEGVRTRFEGPSGLMKDHTAKHWYLQCSGID